MFHYNQNSCWKFQNLASINFFNLYNNFVFRDQNCEEKLLLSFEIPTGSDFEKQRPQVLCLSIEESIFKSFYDNSQISRKK